jgi:hypothetical protein
MELNMLETTYVKIHFNFVINTILGEERLNLRLIKPNTTLMMNYYINRGIQLFNQLPSGIKLIDNNNKFKLLIKNIIKRLFSLLLICLNTVLLPLFIIIIIIFTIIIIKSCEICNLNI